MPYWCLVLRFHIFFFSSRRRHTRFKCDWSSDVCSSDLKEVQRDRTQDQFFAPDVMKTSEHGFPTHRLGSARFRLHLYLQGREGSGSRGNGGKSVHGGGTARSRIDQPSQQWAGDAGRLIEAGGPG